MAGRNWAEVSGKLERHRRTIQGLYRSTLRLETHAEGARLSVAEKFGSLAIAGLHWFDGFPESEAFYQGLLENESSIDRIHKILSDAPRLVPYFKQSLSLTELLISGELEEIEDPGDRIERLALDASPQHVAEMYLHARTLLLTQWTLSSDFNLGNRLADLVDSLIRYSAARLDLEFDILALGTFGTRELGPGSDADVLLLIENPERQQAAEKEAQMFLGFLSQLSRYGAPIKLDMRLRPDGGKGLLVRTYDGLKAYDLDGMEMWERFALGRGRLVIGDANAEEIVHHCAYGLPLSPERLLELTKMKRRIETERVKPQHLHREVKLGSGGLSDIEWLVHLYEMRFPVAYLGGSRADMTERIRTLSQARMLNALEADTLVDANRFLRDLRAKIYLLGIDDDLLPENPDKLDRLAHACGFSDGNSLLSRHQSVVEPVRRLYVDGLERLKL
jgi:glutamate-ammonia-ligase adenylyltransferase